VDPEAGHRSNLLPERWLVPAGVWLAPLGVGLLALALTRIALLPGLAYWDTAELQSVGPLMGTAHPTGFPTYVLLGWFASVVLQPLGDPAFRMNLLAALCVAVAAGVTVDLVRALTRSTALGVLAGVGLTLTPIVWKIGTHAETHALHLALLAILVRLLVAWERSRSNRALVTASVVFGLAVGNHSLTLLLVPAVGLYVIAVQPAIVRRWRLVLACLGALAATVVLVYLELPLRAGPFRAPLVYGHPETWDGFWYVVLAEQFQESLTSPFQDLDLKGLALIGRTVAGFGPLAGLIPIGFAAAVVARPRYALLSGVAVAVTCFFAASYVNADIDRYYLGPALLAWTWIAILAWVVARAIPDALRGLPWLLAAALLLPSLVTAPARLASIDRSRDDQARRWVEGALAAMEPNAMVVSWWSYSTPLWYVQRVEGRRPDIEIVDDRTRLDQRLGEVTDVIDANLPTRPVYVIRIRSGELAELAARYVLIPLDTIGDSELSRVVGRRESST